MCDKCSMLKLPVVWGHSGCSDPKATGQQKICLMNCTWERAQTTVCLNNCSHKLQQIFQHTVCYSMNFVTAVKWKKKERYVFIFILKVLIFFILTVVVVTLFSPFWLPWVFSPVPYLSTLPIVLFTLYLIPPQSPSVALYSTSSYVFIAFPTRNKTLLFNNMQNDLSNIV